MIDYPEIEPIFETTLPQTDEEVIVSLHKSYAPMVARCLVGMYQCHRELGKDVLDAYETVLLKFLEIAEQSTKQPNANTTI